MKRKRRQSLVSEVVPPALAVSVLMLTRVSYAEDTSTDPAVEELTCPRSTVDLGTGYVSKGSYKFGQYNGLQNEGAFAIGDLDLRGGGRYDSDSTTRWSLEGNDLGLQTRSADFDIREQGTFKFDLGYRGLLDNISDTYQTPYLGAGSTFLALPGDWIKPVVPQASPTSLNFRSLSPTAGEGSVLNSAGVLVPPTAAQSQLLNKIVLDDVGAYHNVNLHTERKREDGGFSVNLSQHLELTGSVRHETRNGLQPIGGVTSAVAENSVILPNVIDTTTDQFNLGLQYGAPKGFVQFNYYGSIFRNDVRGMSWQDPNNPALVSTISSAPNNEFHQLNFAGGYNFTPRVKLQADLSYGRNTQNQAFLTDASMPIGVPETSLHGLVYTETANIKLVMQPARGLNVIVHYKYDERANRTPVDTFVFYDVNMTKSGTSPFNAALGLAPNTLGSNVNIFDDRPESWKKNQFDVDADYALARGQKLSGGFNWQQTDSYCEHSWILCVNADTMDERTFHLDWHASLLDSVSATAGYSYAQRRVDYDSNAWLALVPMANVIPAGGATTSAYGYLTQTGLTGFGPLAGFPATPLTGNAAIFNPNNNIMTQSLYGSRDNVSEIPGMRRFDMANRDRTRLRFSLDWQATERWSAQTNLELSDDNYNQSTYGLQNATNWAASLDSTYAVSERLVASAFYTHENQHQRTAGDAYGSNSATAFVGQAADTVVAGPCYTTVVAKNQNDKLDPCLNWTARMIDHADTVGFTLTKKAFLSPRFDLSGDVVFTRAQTNVDVKGGSYANSPFALAGGPALAAGVPAAYYIPAADLPAVTTRTLDLRLMGRISLGKSGDMRLFYRYERMKSTDYSYDGMQFGTGTEQLPTNEQPWNYSVHVVGVSFGYRF